MGSLFLSPNPNACSREYPGSIFGFRGCLWRIWRRQWQPTPVFLPGKSHGRRSLVGCSPWGHEESDTTERLYFHFSLSCIEEGNGNPLQCSCLENPRDGRAWWAAVSGVAQSWTQLKRLSSSMENLGRISMGKLILFYFPSSPSVSLPRVPPSKKCSFGAFHPWQGDLSLRGQTEEKPLKKKKKKKQLKFISRKVALCFWWLYSDS